MNFTSLKYEKNNQIGVITFNTPERLNAISEARLTDLENVLTDIEKDAEIGALVITGGQTKAFCVGLDLDLLDRAFDDIPFFEKVVRRLSLIVNRVEALPIPTIAAINGFARAGGFELSLACDFIILANEASFGDVHTDAGVLPATATIRLARRIGEQRAKEIIWTARWLKGQEAVECGLALRAVPLANLQTEAIAFASTITNKPRVCIASNKRVFQEGRDMEIPAAVELELNSFVRYMTEQTCGKEGYRAYREGRQPSWRT
jgi:enoyl-CoA hydratase/carnithine racemase